MKCLTINIIDTKIIDMNEELSHKNNKFSSEKKYHK